jgi:hypothetical protein
LVERQFSRKIKSVQIDIISLNSFLKIVGIHHRIICTHTHEQNGIVERRHHHIVGTGLSLLGHYKAPLKF